MKSFKNKVAIITGAASGIGRALAQRLAHEGAHVGLCDLDESGLETLKQEIQRNHDVKVFTYRCDVSDWDAMQTFAAESLDSLGPANLVINNAGMEGSGRPVWHTDVECYARVMNVHFMGVVHGTKAFMGQLLSVKEAAILNVSSLFGLIAPPNVSDYSAAKFAIRGFTESLMVELQESHVQAHLLHPGGIKTNIIQHEHTEKFGRKFLTTPPEELAKVVLQGIREGKPRIVYGNGAAQGRMLSQVVPLGVRTKLLWRSMSRLARREDYPPRVDD